MIGLTFASLHSAGFAEELASFGVRGIDNRILLGRLPDWLQAEGIGADDVPAPVIEGCLTAVRAPGQRRNGLFRTSRRSPRIWVAAVSNSGQLGRRMWTGRARCWPCSSATLYKIARSQPRRCVPTPGSPGCSWQRCLTRDGRISVFYPRFTVRSLMRNNRYAILA